MKVITTFLAALWQAIQKDYNVALAGVFQKKKNSGGGHKGLLPNVWTMFKAEGGGHRQSRPLPSQGISHERHGPHGWNTWER